MYRPLLRAAAMLALASLAACASVVDGTTQNITVKTDPAGASCELLRENLTVAVVNPTPGTVNVSKDADDITIVCDKEDFQTAKTTITSKFTGATFGNIILGGGIGILVDAASGANNRYPENVDMLMTPVSFASIADRDRFFDRTIARARDRAEKANKVIEKECAEEYAGSAYCEDAPEEVKATLEAAIQRLEADRRNAVIGEGGATTSTAPQPTPAEAPRQAATAPVPAATAAAQQAAGNPDCQEQASRLGLASFNCLKVQTTGSFEVGRRCESSYFQVTKKKLLRAGDEIVAESATFTGSQVGTGGADVVCLRAIPGTWAFSKNDPERFVILDRYDRGAVWCKGGAGC